ncbi:MAG: CDP-glycerol glycerophosphotransferase family protein [Eggerthellaceae bacterium]|nr:CDP-glycerol glycerophosphotransferase family protein [Eggerthellaceae bacterium]
MFALSIKAACVILRVIYFFMKLAPTKNKIVFVSRQSNVPSIDFRLLQAELEKALPDFSFVVKCKTFTENPKGFLNYFPVLLSQMSHMATAKLVILDSYCLPVSVLNHKRDLKVLQIGHAIGLMKKAGHAAIGVEEGRSAKLAKAFSMHRGYTHVLVSSPACEEAILQVFGYAPDSGVKGQKPLQGILTGALPRVDYSQDEKIRTRMATKIYQTYPFLENKKVIVYAPTSRKNSTDFPQKVKELIEAVSEANKKRDEFALVLKLHQKYRNRWESKIATINQSQAGDFDIQDTCVLFDKKFSSIEMGMIAHACVSDYSSLVYEFIAMQKPTYFFAFDLDEYEKERGIFIDYRREVPGKVYAKAKSLVSAIAQEEYSPQEQRAFLEKYVSYTQGSNTHDLAARIIGVIENI